jgi:hypothetical protein
MPPSTTLRRRSKRFSTPNPSLNGINPEQGRAAIGIG